MNINISGHHLDITPSLHEHITKKFLKIKTHFDYVIDVKFILSVEKLTHIAEATIHLPNIDIHAKSTDKDMYHGIDLLIGKLDRQVIKYKEKIKDHHKSDNSYKTLL
tara:strand:+ start:269 stop:589 length:321 start_codon:yes stop_codon:yes gene_type:complete